MSRPTALVIGVEHEKAKDVISDVSWVTGHLAKHGWAVESYINCEGKAPELGDFYHLLWFSGECEKIFTTPPDALLYGTASVLSLLRWTNFAIFDCCNIGQLVKPEPFEGGTPCLCASMGLNPNEREGYNLEGEGSVFTNALQAMEKAWGDAIFKAKPPFLAPHRFDFIRDYMWGWVRNNSFLSGPIDKPIEPMMGWI